MKIKLLGILIVLCLLLCSCGANQQSNTNNDSETVTTTENSDIDTTEDTTAGNVQGDELEDDIPSLFTTDPDTTEIDLDDLFEEIIGDNKVELPPIFFEDNPCTPPVPVTTVPVTVPETTETDENEPPIQNTTVYDPDVLPEHTWEDEG